MSSYLKGRALWCCATCSETLIVPDEYTNTLKKTILDFAIDSLQKEKAKSVKLIATRALVKYSRKIDKETLKSYSKQFESVLDSLLLLLDSSRRDVMHLPIEAFYIFSKADSEIVSNMAP